MIQIITDSTTDTNLNNKSENINKNNSFGIFKLSEPIMKSLSILGYDNPTQIQIETISQILNKKDIVGQSKTGSGKTAAFAIPICEKVRWEENAPIALVLEPTRELAVQVADEMSLIGKNKKIKVPVAFGGMPVDKQAISLKQKSHIVVGTPGRIIDHIKRENINLSNIQYLVIDEADLMLDMGFIDDVSFIIEKINTKPCKMLFSATIENSIENLIEKYMNNPVRIVVKDILSNDNSIEQIAYEVNEDNKFSVFFSVLVETNPEYAMIFCDTREMVNTLYQKLKRKKIKCIMLHGALEQRERLYAISDFKKGIAPYLITTDVASRGIDFPNMPCVINYDFPTNKANYVHRIGRTGRNKSTGIAISFISNNEERYKNIVEEYIDRKIPIKNNINEISKEMYEAFDKRHKTKLKIKPQKGDVFNKSIIKLTICCGKKSKIRPGDIVGSICAIPNITMDDIGIIDVRDSITYVDIHNGLGQKVYDGLSSRTIKGKVRKVRIVTN